MTSRTIKERFKKSYRCPEDWNRLTFKNGKWYCPEHGIIPKSMIVHDDRPRHKHINEIMFDKLVSL